MGKILVTGGCGYIGSHTLIDLLEHGFEVVAVDSNVRSDVRMLNAVERITGKKVSRELLDLCDKAAVQEMFERYEVLGVIHFAAYKSVPESVANPLMYYHNNLTGLLNVLECMQMHQLSNLIFSSSCSVYGNTTALPVLEETPMEAAQSPYARTKQMCEAIIQDFAVANAKSNSILLRYFNPGGAHPSGQLGEIPQEGAYNVLPILMEALEGKRATFMVTGDDHPTPDGSCVRDYIHVMDVAHAHTKALQYLLKEQNDQNCEVFNIGLGKGVSVLELIEAFNRATGQELSYKIGPRRAGDVSSIYAHAQKANERLNWHPQYSIDELLASSWLWYKNGYPIS
ncbi:MAG: UDP-glucose 4-epimerase GalE [Aureispira sp.]